MGSADRLHGLPHCISVYRFERRLYIDVNHVQRLSGEFQLTSCAKGRHSMPPSLPLDLLTLKVVIQPRLTWATFVPILVFLVPRPLCSRLRPDVCDSQTDRQTERQTSDRQTSDAHHWIMPLGRGIISKVQELRP